MCSNEKRERGGDRFERIEFPTDNHSIFSLFFKYRWFGCLSEEKPLPVKSNNAIISQLTMTHFPSFQNSLFTLSVSIFATRISKILCLFCLFKAQSRINTLELSFVFFFVQGETDKISRKTERLEFGVMCSDVEWWVLQFP